MHIWTNDVQSRFQNWNRISRIFRDGGIGIGIELNTKITVLEQLKSELKLEAKISRRIGIRIKLKNIIKGGM